jgi:uncharacterized protein YukE
MTAGLGGQQHADAAVLQQTAARAGDVANSIRSGAHSAKPTLLGMAGMWEGPSRLVYEGVVIALLGAIDKLTVDLDNLRDATVFSAATYETHDQDSAQGFHAASSGLPGGAMGSQVNYT